MQKIGFTLHHVENQDVSFKKGIYGSVLVLKDCNWCGSYSLWMKLHLLHQAHTNMGIWDGPSMQVAAVGVCCLCAMCCTVM